MDTSIYESLGNLSNLIKEQSSLLDDQKKILNNHTQRLNALELGHDQLQKDIEECLNNCKKK